MLGIAALAVLLLAGCGNEKRDFRVDQLNPLVKRLSEERATLAAVLRDSRPRREGDARALRDQVSRVASVAGRIAALSPPGGVDAKFRRYTRANAALLASLRAFVDAFATGDDAAQRRAGDRTGAMLAAANRAQVELQHALK